MKKHTETWERMKAQIRDFYANMTTIYNICYTNGSGTLNKNKRLYVHLSVSNSHIHLMLLGF